MDRIINELENRSWKQLESLYGETNQALIAEIKRNVFQKFILESSSERQSQPGISQEKGQGFLDGLLWAIEIDAALLFVRTSEEHTFKLLAQSHKHWVPPEQILACLEDKHLKQALQEGKIQAKFPDLTKGEEEIYYLFVPLGEDLPGLLVGAIKKRNFSFVEINLFQTLGSLFSLWQGSEAVKLLKMQLEKLDDREFKLLTISQISKALSGTLDMDEILFLLTDSLSEVMHSELVLILLADEEGTRMEVSRGRYALELQKTIPQFTIKMGENLNTWVEAQRGTILPITSFDKPDFNKVFPKLTSALKGLKIQVLIPLIYKWKFIGMIAVGEKYTRDLYDKEDLEFLTILGQLSANSISNVQFYELSITDALTRLFVPRYFRQRFNEEIKRAKRYKQPLSIIMWDIDHFKWVNDNHGHLKGNDVLRKLGRIFKEHTRTDVDIVARYGGEEFVMLLPETHKEGATAIAERLRNIVAEYPFFNTEKISLSISGGVSTYPEDGETFNELIDKADARLYKAKQQGRNRVCF